MHPRNRISRMYEAEIEGRLDDKLTQRIKKGVFIGDNEWGNAEIMDQKTVKKRSKIVLRLRQGKKREIRRIFEFQNIRLFSLHRVSYGPIELGNLPVGQWRTLTAEEIKTLPH